MNRHRIIHEIAKARVGQPGVWGSSDCIHFAADVAMAIIGRDPIDSIRCSYDSETGSKRVMIKNGWKNLNDVAAAFFPEVPKSMAATGDWATLDLDGVETIGVVIGHQIVAQSESGIAFRPMSAAVKAFKVE